MEQELEVFQKLLNDFSKVHIPKTEKTFMGICQYPGSRFEEICSRILAFYFNPNEEHGFRDLWFRALNQCIKQERDSYEFPSEIRLEEKTSENKRIDILIETANNVYAIENKIGATLYNPLDNYEGHLNTHYRQKQHIMIVLSARSLTIQEREKLSKWKEISYKNLFEIVKKNSGLYISPSNHRHFLFMLDFMDTINNKMNFMENEELNKFFSNNDNVENMKNLNSAYEYWQRNISSIRLPYLRDIIERFNKKLSLNVSEPYEGWLFSTGIKNTGIGIEGNFEFEGNNPIGAFNYWICIWINNCSDINFYLDKLNKAYGNAKRKENKYYWYMKGIRQDKKDENTYKDEIVNCLSTLYDKVLKKIIIDN